MDAFQYESGEGAPRRSHGAISRTRREKNCTRGNAVRGQQQLLAIARGLMVTPTLLLLDEPTIGLSPRMVSEVFETIRAIKERSHTTIMIVEHNIKSLVHIVNRAVILDKGKIVRDEGDVSKLLEGDALGLPLGHYHKVTYSSSLRFVPDAFQKSEGYRDIQKIF